MVKLHQLRDAIAVADRGSLRAAARHLNIAQSAITNSLRQLERELDVPLFERHRRGVISTPVGAAFLEKARAASAELERAQEEIRQLRGEETGNVTIGLSTVPQLVILPEIIRAFHARYPFVRLSVVEALGFPAVEASMRSGEMDAYIGSAPLGELGSDYQAERLFLNERCIILRKNHGLRSVRNLAQLTAAHWITNSATTAATSFTRLFKENQLPIPEKVTYAGSSLSQILLLMNTDAIMVGPRLLLQIPRYADRLTCLDIEQAIPPTDIVLIRPGAVPLTPAADHFCGLARQVFAPHAS